MDKAEIDLPDLDMRRARAGPVQQASGTNMLGGVHKDIHLGADVGREIGRRFLVGEVERHNIDAFNGAQRGLAGKRLPWLGNADKYR